MIFELTHMGKSLNTAGQDPPRGSPSLMVTLQTHSTNLITLSSSQHLRLAASDNMFTKVPLYWTVSTLM